MAGRDRERCTFGTSDSGRTVVGRSVRRAADFLAAPLGLPKAPAAGSSPARRRHRTELYFEIRSAARSGCVSCPGGKTRVKTSKSRRRKRDSSRKTRWRGVLRFAQNDNATLAPQETSERARIWACTRKNLWSMWWCAANAGLVRWNGWTSSACAISRIPRTSTTRFRSRTGGSKRASGSHQNDLPRDWRRGSRNGEKAKASRFKWKCGGKRRRLQRRFDCAVLPRQVLPCDGLDFD